MRDKSLNRNDKLDRAGRSLVRESVLSDSEAGALADSPFLFARVRSRIARDSESEAGNIWAGFWLVSRKAIVGMGLAAAFSLGLYFYTGNKSGGSAFSVDAYLGTSESGIDNMLFAERRQLTPEEVFATIVSREERESGR